MFQFVNLVSPISKENIKFMLSSNSNHQFYYIMEILTKIWLSRTEKIKIARNKKKPKLVHENRQ